MHLNLVIQKHPHFHLAKRTEGLTSTMMMPQEKVEWPDPIEGLIDQLENESSERDFTREERALMDIYETVPILQSDDSLHEFWQSGIDQQRIINSFELIGATSLVDPLNASRWCETRPEDRNDYSETEANHLATIEEELIDGMDELIDLLLVFVEEEIN